MKVVLLYLRILKCSDPKFPIPKDYETSAKRFLETYNHFRPSIPHELVIVNCGSETHDGLFDSIASRYESDFTGGFDCGSWQHVGGRQDCDLVVGLNTHTYFWRDGWLEPIVKCAEKYGQGVYGVGGSYEQHPHLRTPCIAFSPNVVREYPYVIDTRELAGWFEFGPDNFSLWARKNNYACRLVTPNNSYGMTDWRKTRNGFRQGDQSEVLVFDRHTEIYANADRATKLHLQKAANNQL